MVMMSGYEVGKTSHVLVMKPVIPRVGMVIPPVGIPVVKHSNVAPVMRGESRSLPEAYIKRTHVVEAINNSAGNYISNRNMADSTRKLKQYSYAAPMKLPNANKMFDDIGNIVGTSIEVIE